MRPIAKVFGSNARPLSLMALGVAAFGLASNAAAQSPSGGTYEYVSPETTGALRLEPGDAISTVLIETVRDGARCRFLGQGTFRDDAGGDNEARFDLPDGVLTVRLFDDNAEIETTGSTRSICDAGARIAGVYISTSPSISFDRDHMVSTQERLSKLGLSVGAIDGLMGPRTRQAMNRFEADAGLPQRQNLTLATFYQLEAALDDVITAASDIRPIPVDRALDEDDRLIALEFMNSVPERHRDLIDTLYGDLVAPQQIDWNNPPFELALIDLTTGEPAHDNDRPDVVTFFNDRQFCDGNQCRLEVLHHSDGVYLPVLEGQSTAVALGGDRSNGLVDFVLNESNIWRFDGERYEHSTYEPEPVR